MQLIASAADVDGIGYKFMAGGRLMTRDRGRGETDQQSMAEAQDAFEAKMAEVEQLLGRHPEGPFFMGCAWSPACWPAVHRTVQACAGRGAQLHGSNHAAPHKQAGRLPDRVTGRLVVI